MTPHGALLLMALSFFQAVFSASHNTSFDVFTLVNQLIGTSDGGNSFPGATLPYGFAKAVADVTGNNAAGFAPDGSEVTGFSGMHDSGTGGAPSLGIFPLFPHAGCLDDVIDGCKFAKKERKLHYINDSVLASPGYFSLTLESRIKAEMTVTNHTSLYRFTFPKKPSDGSPLSPLMLLDLTDLQDSRYNGSISVDPETGRMVGNATFQPSFGSGTYTAFFCADFKGASIRDTGIFVNSRAGTEPKDLFITRGINGFPLPGGGFVRFKAPDKDNVLFARVATSFISAAQACSNAEKEIPKYDFEEVKSTAQEIWRKQLSPMSVIPGKGVSDALQQTFWSGIYRTMINPQDYTGENPLWKSPLPYFDSFYCLWDSFRSQLPFLMVIDPMNLSRMINGMLNIYQNQGYLPDCRMSLCKGYTQGGSNADNVIVDAYVKKLPGIDWDLAYEAVVKDAEVEPLEWSVEGRGGLTSWKNLGYIPASDFDPIGFGTMTRSISRTLEYSYNEHCIAEMAAGLGHTADAEKYRKRSENYKNIFKADQTSSLPDTGDTGFKGFFQPKFLNQTWGFQDPALCSNIPAATPKNTACSLQAEAGETFESSIWEYMFYVPGDMASLVTLFGGPEAFIKRLDFLHDSGLNYIGNEPTFLTIFLYHYAGRPGLSAKRSHSYIPGSFKATPSGLPGNDDGGAMGSLLAFAMMGLFPNAGQNVYLLTAPYFESVSVKNPMTGHTATIRNVNFDAAYENIYIQSATLDGKPYTRNWIGHEFFVDGGELVLVLGKNESSWGTRSEDLPPSSSTRK